MGVSVFNRPWNYGAFTYFVHLVFHKSKCVFLSASESSVEENIDPYEFRDDTALRDLHIQKRLARFCVAEDQTF